MFKKLLLLVAIFAFVQAAATKSGKSDCPGAADPSSGLTEDFLNDITEGLSTMCHKFKEAVPSVMSFKKSSVNPLLGSAAPGQSDLPDFVAAAYRSRLKNHQYRLKNSELNYCRLASVENKQNMILVFLQKFNSQKWIDLKIFNPISTWQTRNELMFEFASRPGHNSTKQKSISLYI
ncbi:hypothetical protein RUM44_000199 [Polyplax serrata]|uniref:Uncharacterized protein n=1 Tax=Polyplax serrata TaxID=468196 RepID=A0ABR1B691_POLSC